MLAQSTNRIGFNKGTENNGIMQENSIQNVGSDGGCRKDSASDFDHDYIENARREFVVLTDSISEVVECCKRSLYGMRGDIDHLDTRLRDLVLLTRELKTLEKKKKGNINTIVLLLALIFIALFSLGVFLCLG